MARLLSDMVIGRPWRDFFGLPLRFWIFTRVTVTLKVCSTAARTVYFVAFGNTSKVYWPKFEESLLDFSVRRIVLRILSAWIRTDLRWRGR